MFTSATDSATDSEPEDGEIYELGMAKEAKIIDPGW
jgi:hypothetical protein